ncbi:MAG: DsbA family oxidoreductase [Bacteroidetes bacterium]|jgi:predicted DsbA family dithiol-disulfide isomerase|nr:DsbA family oxidoreductase [Bacteroidota bacterium]
MKVEIWSDVMCPFCYIGKRKFEKALEQFPHKDKINIIWKSFQLDPDSVTDPNLNAIDHLAQRKGWSKEQTIETTQHVASIARQVGLDFHFEKAVVANSFDAHRLSHLAKKYNKQNELEEKLFAAYFSEEKNTGDHSTLLQIGKELHFDENELTEVLNGDAYSKDVEQDILEAQQIGVRGVPFFVIDRKYAVSGAQDPETFLNALNKAYEEQPATDSN